MPMAKNEKGRISVINLRNAHSDHNPVLLTRDHDTALRDLETESLFQPVNDEYGPYDVALSVEENRLIFKVRNSQGSDMPMLVLSLKPYKRLIKDYFLIVESYDKAVSEGQPSRIEAIDVGRRGLHNEGASLLLERLEDKITMDLDTARRLFTLICVLHAGPGLLWR